MTKVLVATHNKNKGKELKALLSGLPDVKVLILDDLDVNPPIIIEDGRTFRQNAVKKAVITSKFFDGLVLADDSGLEVEALHGRPGVRSARFARAKATDQENNEKLLKLLEKVPGKSRKARFVCCIALADKGVLLESFEGKVEGSLLDKPRGKNGFGYDPLFVPEGCDKNFAEMTPAYKNRISHRGIALKKLKEAIKKYI